MDWKKKFNVDIENKWALMNDEYQNYLRTNNIGYLQQAGNKLFLIVENYLQIKYMHRINNYRELKLLIRNNVNDYDLLVSASQLHYFFYNGEVQMQRDEAEFFYLKIHKKTKIRLNN